MIHAKSSTTAMLLVGLVAMSAPSSAAAGTWNREGGSHRACGAVDKRTFHGTGLSLKQCQDKCEADPSCGQIFGHMSDWTHGDGSCWTCPPPNQSQKTQSHENDYTVWTLTSYDRFEGKWELADDSTASVTLSEEVCKTEGTENSFTKSMKQSVTAGAEAGFFFGSVSMSASAGFGQEWYEKTSESTEHCTSTSRTFSCPNGNKCGPTEKTYRFVMEGRRNDGSTDRVPTCNLICVPGNYGAPVCPSKENCNLQRGCGCCLDTDWAAPPPHHAAGARIITFGGTSADSKYQLPPVCPAPTVGPRCMYGEDQVSCMEWVGSTGACNTGGRGCLNEFCAECPVGADRVSLRGAKMLGSSSSSVLPVGSDDEFVALVRGASISEGAKTNLLQNVVNRS